MTEIIFQGVAYNATHGSPFDRGRADSYYGREEVPHMGGVGINGGPRVTSENMTLKEMSEYFAGYRYNELHGDKKEYV
jgi:hypothetical protein